LVLLAQAAEFLFHETVASYSLSKIRSGGAITIGGGKLALVAVPARGLAVSRRTLVARCG